MGMSRRAKRDLAIFQKIQWSQKNAMYHLSPKNMIKLDFRNPLIDAATDAMKILVKNGEDAKNANVQKLSNSEGYTVTPDPEGQSIPSVSVQPKADEIGTESGPSSTERGA